MTSGPMGAVMSVLWLSHYGILIATTTVRTMAIPATTPALSLEPRSSLRDQLEELEEKSRSRALAVAVHDLETGFDFRYRADRWFHAASTIKLAVLLGTFGAIHRGKLVPQSRLHVRNRFRSAYDGSSFRVLSERDADSEVQAAIGKTMRIGELARHMIVRSSNLATNLLLDLLGLEHLQKTLDQHHITGMD